MNEKSWVSTLFFRLWIIAFLLCGEGLFAETKVPNRSGSRVPQSLKESSGPLTQTAACPQLQNSQDILQCILQKHPELSQLDTLLDKAKETQNASRVWSNPDFNFRNIFVGSTAQSVPENELNITQPIELGGKRGSRIQKAKANFSVSLSERQQILERLTLQTVTTLYRVREIREEIHLLDEAMSTFKDLQKQYLQRGRLTPEQAVSLDILQMAEKDYAHRKIELQNEEEALIHFFHVAIDPDFNLPEAALPPRKVSWPTMQRPMIVAGGGTSQKAAADMEIAQSDLEMQKALRWPDLRLGPSMQIQNEGTTRNSYLGFNIGFSIPLWNWNSAQVRAAEFGLQASDLKFRFVRAALDEEWEERSEIYQRCVGAMGKDSPDDKMKERHKSLHGYITRGLVSAALVIELHRQLFDFMVSYHHNELKAIESLWTLYILEGRALTERLE